MSSGQKIYSFISSMKTGLVLLLLIGLASAVGSSLQPDTFFRTPFFETLLLLLLLNMILCTVNRFKKTYSVILKPVGSKVWFRQTGILLLHLGIVLVLIGGIVNAGYGQNTTVHLLAGDQINMDKVLKLKHPFAIRLDEFKIEFNKDGSPSQYISEITILEDRQEIKSVAISVNHPLNYKGVKAYQSSFGHLVKAKYTAENREEKLGQFMEGETIQLANTKREVKIFRYIPNFHPAHGLTSATMRPDNPHVIYSVYEGDELLGVGAAKLNESTNIDEDADIVFTGVEPYTILQVKSDPGLPLVLAGGIAFMLGVCVAILAAPVKRKAVQADHKTKILDGERTS